MVLTHLFALFSSNKPLWGQDCTIRPVEALAIRYKTAEFKRGIGR
jgi:hypothetical protein